MEWYARWEAYVKQEENADSPGPINSDSQLQRLFVTRDLVLFGELDYFFTDFNLKDGAKEEVHYKVLD